LSVEFPSGRIYGREFEMRDKSESKEEMVERLTRQFRELLEKTLKTVEEILDKNYLLSNVGEYTESGELSDRPRVSKRCSECGKDYPIRFGDCPFCYTQQTSEKLVEKKAIR